MKTTQSLGKSARLLTAKSLALVSCALTLSLPSVSAQTIATFFSPLGGCEGIIVQQINGARQSVHMQAYQLSDRAIAFALVAATRRNVEVLVVVDGRHLHNAPLAEELAASGVNVEADSMHATAHNKVVIVDHFTLLTGSYNYSRIAETGNAENLLMIRDQKTVEAFESNFAAHRQHSHSL